MNAIEIKGLTKVYEGKTVVDNLQLDIIKGETFGLLGVNGAGKTTTIKMLSCLLKPTSGDATLLGHSILTEANQVKKISNVSPQETAVAPNLTVRENLELIAGIYNMDRKSAKLKADSIIEEFSLGEYEKTLAKKLSGGWQRKLSIAMALISDPEILFLDEPTLGLDVLARRELWDEIERLKGKVTVILTTHYLEEAEYLSDRIAIMAKGKLMDLGTAAELKKHAGTDDFETAFVTIAREVK